MNSANHLPKPQYPDLKGKVALVTGGANGIGSHIVRALHSQGARVYFCDVDETAAETLCKELHGEVSFSRVNLIQEQEIKRWIKGIVKQEGAIHVLVNNAAADPRIPLHETTVEQWDTLFARNLRSYFLTIRECAGSMPSGASIINFSSLTFHQAPAMMSAYVATKSGIIGLTRSLARELGPRRIRVNTISPGWIMTERQLREHVGPKTKKLIQTSQCIPDLLQPQDMAEVVLFLASDTSRAITGQEILADRGWFHS